MSSLNSLDTALGASPANDQDHPKMAPRDPSTHCLFCPHPSPGLSANLSHMRLAHSFLIPSPDRLLVDIETFLEYLDTVINDLAQCIHCFTQRRDGEAVRCHMRDKGHCRIEVDGVWSGEWREFYRSGYEDEEIESEDDGSGSDSGAEGSNGEEKPAFVRLDDSTARLPSGKILSSSHRKTRRRLSPNSLDPLNSEPVSIAEASSPDPQEPSTPAIQTLSTSLRARKQSQSLQTALTQLRASDRAALAHLPEAQQRAQLAIQRHQGASATRAQQEVSGNVAQKGNKTLMKHFQPRVRKRHNGFHRESLKA